MSEARVLADAPWLRSGPAARVLAVLNGGGEEARVVGGAVRNALLRLPTGDIDIATTAVPDEVVRRRHQERADRHRSRYRDAGRRQASVRGDDAARGRRNLWPQGQGRVRPRLGARRQRRDFTINGLSVDAEGIVHDHVGGLDDIAARRVRFIGDPAQRIAEDFLRILRFFRMHASYGVGEPDRDGYFACIAGRAGLENLSAERIRMEVLKLVVADGAAAAAIAMADAGLLGPIFAGVTYSGPFAAMIAAERALGLKASAVRRLGALAVAVTEDAARIAGRLRLSNAEAEALHAMGDRWWRFMGIDEAGSRRLLYRLGDEAYRNQLLLAWSRTGAVHDADYWRGLASLPQRWQAPKFPLKAADFIARGIAEGPALGHVLAQAEEVWLAADLPMQQAEISAIADQTVTRFARDHRL